MKNLILYIVCLFLIEATIINNASADVQSQVKKLIVLASDSACESNCSVDLHTCESDCERHSGSYDRRHSNNSKSSTWCKDSCQNTYNRCLDRCDRK